MRERFVEMGNDSSAELCTIKSGDNKGTIRNDIQYLLVSTDVRRHPSISSDYIKMPLSRQRPRVRVPSPPPYMPLRTMMLAASRFPSLPLQLHKREMAMGFVAKAGTSVTYTTSSTLGGTGSFTRPRYTVYAEAWF